MKQSNKYILEVVKNIATKYIDVVNIKIYILQITK